MALRTQVTGAFILKASGIAGFGAEGGFFGHLPRLPDQGPRGKVCGQFP
jgi:predicted NBD/HSP70 family sugar kinase